MHYVYISVLLVSLCLRIPEPEFCDNAFFLFEVIDHQLQEDMAIWMVTVLDGSPIEWGLPSLSLSGSSSCSVDFLVYAAWMRVPELSLLLMD
jgi:hypothetical protein